MSSLVTKILANGPLGPTLAPLLEKSATATSIWKRWDGLYASAAGYRKRGYLADDLIPEESEIVQKAISRLPEKEKFDRVFRLRRGIVQSMQHKDLPKSEWVLPAEDRAYLSPYIKEVVAEERERAQWDYQIVESLLEKKAKQRTFPFV
ncbi:hypothetical protein IAT38_007185 [Cryptococcus sp. DSM 104549]